MKKLLNVATTITHYLLIALLVVAVFPAIVSGAVVTAATFALCWLGVYAVVIGLMKYGNSLCSEH